MKKNLSISNILILISIIFTILVYSYPNLYILWINNFFYNKWDYLIYFIQFFTWSFIHWWFLHIFMNSVFIYYFWNQLENYIWKKIFFLFYITATIFIWFSITKFSNWNTIWISWFAMAVLAYYTSLLYKLKNPEYKWWITAIILMIWIWLSPWISLIWHFSWAIFWILFFLITNKKKK